MSRTLPRLVAVTATTRVMDGLPRVRLNEVYVRALEAVGLVPVIVPPLAASLAAPLLGGVAGLVLTGGEDVAPSHYGAEPHTALGEVHAARDEWELALVAAARQRRLPTLAICRGLQLLGVALGGTLVQDIPAERPSELAHAESERRAMRVHEVAIEPGSRLARALGATGITANSSHHQALDRVPTSLRVVARAPDGIVEGVETTDDWWMLGVQWHPEELVGTPEPWDRRLFESFAEAVRGDGR